MHFSSKTDPATTNANTQAIATLAMQHSFGKKVSHSLMTGLGEFSREFMYEGKAFGHYIINDQQIFFINETKLNEEQKKMVTGVPTKNTDASGILMLSVGPVSFLPREIEQTYEAVKRDHEEN